jgi:hypothetical protein
MHPFVSKFLRVLLLVWLGWLLLGNVLLNTGLGPQLINRKPDAFTLDWQRGLTLWPGQAWLWDVRARGQVRRLQWNAQAARTSGRIAVLPLLWRQLRVPAIDAAQAQLRLDTVDHDRQPPPPRPGGWTLRFDAIASDSLRSVHLDGVQLDGDGRARIGLRKQLRGGPLEVLPSTGAMTAARLSRDDGAVLWTGDLQATFALPEHLRERAPGWSRLGLADAHLTMSGSTAGLAVAVDEQGTWQTRLNRADDAGAGRIDLDVHLRNGVLLSGGRVELTLPLSATDGAQQWQANGQVGVSVAPDRIDLVLRLPPPPGDAGNLDAHLAIAGRSLPFACVAPAPAERALGPLCTLDLDTERQLARVDGAVDLRWSFDSLTWLQPLLIGAPWLQLDGAGQVQAQLQVAKGTLAPGSELTVPVLKTRIEVLDNVIEGDAHAHARIVDGDGGDPRLALALAVDQFSMVPADHPDQVYVQGRDLQLDLDASGRIGRWHDSVAGRLQFSDAQVPDLAVYNRYLPGTGVRLLGGRGSLSGDLHVDAAGDVGEGRLQLTAQRTGLRLGGVDVTGDLALDTRLQRADLQTRRFQLDGSSVQLSRVRVRDGERLVGEDWWANLDLVRGQLDWQHPLRLDAQVQARARNIALVLGMFGPLREFPRWTRGLVDQGEARLEGRARLDDGALLLSPMQAGNDRFDVQMRLRLADRQPHGDLLLTLGRLRAGLQVASDERNWHLRDASDWFHSRAPSP